MDKRRIFGVLWGNNPTPARAAAVPILWGFGIVGLVALGALLAMLGSAGIVSGAVLAQVVVAPPRTSVAIPGTRLPGSTRARIAQFRPVETIVPPAGLVTAVPTRTKIPRDYVLQDLQLFVSGTIQVAVLNGLSLRPEQPMSIIRRIQIQAASGRRPTLAQLKDADAAALFRLQHILLGTPPLSTALTTPNIGTYNFSFDIPIDFQLTKVIEDLMRPFSGPGETLLRGDEMNALDLVIDWGIPADLIEPGATTSLTLTNVQAVLGVREYKDPESLGQRYKLHRLSNIEQVNAGASSSFTFDLRGRNILRGLLVKQFTQGATATTHTPVDTVILALKLRLNSETREEWDPEDFLRADNKKSFSVETMPPGYLFLDLLHGGHRELAIQTGGFTSVDLLLTTATVTDSKVRVYPVEIIP